MVHDNPMGFTQKITGFDVAKMFMFLDGFPMDFRQGFPAGRNAFDVAYDSDSSGSHREVTGYNTFKPFMRTIHE